MSLMRALTKRTKRTGAEISPPSSPTHSNTLRKMASTIDRSKISSPVALISSTNALSYDAPDLATFRQAPPSSSASTVSSRSSVNDSDASSTSNQSHETFTDASSVDSPPPSPNHLSCYFEAANPTSTTKTVRRSRSSVQFREKTVPIEAAPALAPAVPQRALSHSKKAHEQLARKRSLQHMSSSSIDRTAREQRRTLEHRSSIDMFRGSVEPSSHPFGSELAQLDEVVEEFTTAVREVEVDEDTKAMQQKGLLKFCAADYMMEIQPLFADMFGTPQQVAWI